jgi:metallo-beta-lactamase class B
VASRGDAPGLEAGAPSQPAVHVDRVIDDGARVELGGTVLTAHVTPGHTKGCTTWSMTTQEAGKTYRVVFFCSTSVVERLVGNAAYPDIVADYEKSFPILRALPCDVFLGPHPDFFRMHDKLAQRKPGAPNPFIDPDELRRYVAESEQKFRATLASERPAAAPK